MVVGKRKLQVATARALSQVVKVKAHVHRVSLSADEEMEERLRWAFNEKAHRLKHKAKDWYQKKGIIHTYYGSLIIFYGKPRANMREVLIQTADTSPKLFGFLANVAPDLLVSSAEFSVDLIVGKHEPVADLFCAVRRNAYFPRWSGEILLFGDCFAGWGDTPQLNRVYKVLRAGGGRSIKVYERGPDRFRQKSFDGTPFWSREDLDRVRIEVTLDRSDTLNKQKVLGKVGEFVAAPNIYGVIDRHVQFKCFAGSNVLPSEFDSYRALDNSGYDQSFQAEYREAKDSVQNPSQYLMDASCMVSFRKRLLRAARKTDRDWSNGVAVPVE